LDITELLKTSNCKDIKTTAAESHNMQVTKEDGERLARELGLHFVEACATGTAEASEPFRVLADIVLAAYHRQLAQFQTQLVAGGA
jgi:hypothetical protein